MMGQPVDPSMMQPPPPDPVLTVNSYDNHQVHIDVHNRFRKSQAYEMLDDVIKQEFELHVNAHLMAISDAMSQVDAVTGAAGPDANIPPQDGPQEEATEPVDNPAEDAAEQTSQGGPPNG